MAPSPRDILSLYKKLFSRAYKFDNYNFREYSKRRIHDAFRENKNLSKEDDIIRFYNDGINNLALLERQTAISQMFTLDKLVVEPLKGHK